MSLFAFIATFWPLIAAEALGLVILPIGIVIALARFDRRREVKRMHRMRRATHLQ